MNYPTAIVLTAIIISGTVLTQNLAQSQVTNQSPVNAFEGVPTGINAVNVVDTRTGRVAYCRPKTAADSSSPLAVECGPFSPPSR